MLNQINLGPSKARNEGLYIAKGKYVMFVDADDYLERDMLEICLNEIGSHDIIITSYYTILNKDDNKTVYKNKLHS